MLIGEHAACVDVIIHHVERHVEHRHCTAQRTGTPETVRVKKQIQHDDARGRLYCCRGTGCAAASKWGAGDARALRTYPRIPDDRMLNSAMTNTRRCARLRVRPRRPPSYYTYPPRPLYQRLSSVPDIVDCVSGRGGPSSRRTRPLRRPPNRSPRPAPVGYELPPRSTRGAAPLMPPLPASPRPAPVSTYALEGGAPPGVGAALARSRSTSSLSSSSSSGPTSRSRSSIRSISLWISRSCFSST